MNSFQDKEPEAREELVLGVESVSAVFAHDIATPLTTARMNAELLVEYFSYLSKGLESEGAAKIPPHIRTALENAPDLIKKNIDAIQQSLVDYKQYLNALQHEAEKDESAGSTRHKSTASLKILLVDDEDIHHDIAGAVLGERHILMHEKSGERALAVCRDKEFDVILMDMKMPGLSGEQTVEQLRKFLPASTLILGLTNLPIGQSHDFSAQGGFNGFMEKPLRLDIFEIFVETVGEKKSLS